VRTNKELFDLSGQVAIVTGGVYGLGVQLAYALGEAGANLVIAARGSMGTFFLLPSALTT